MDKSMMRKLPGYKDGIVCVKDIINSESKFNNRKRPEGWITPTTRQLVQTHMSAVRRICRILPVTKWCIEINRFAFMKLENSRCYGLDFQNGRMKGYSSVNEYVSARQSGRCYICGAPVENFHHMVPKHELGSNLPENIVGLCRLCHEKVHTGKLKLDISGIRKQYGALSVLNQAIPYILRELEAEFPGNVYTCTGAQASEFRNKHGLPKDHDTDAYSIGCTASGTEPEQPDALPEKFETLQFRRHDRQRIRSVRERTYKLDGVLTAKNRNPRFEQSKDTPSLSDWYRTRCCETDKHTAQAERSRLSAIRSARYYNNMNRLLPGTEFIYNGEKLIMTGQLSGGQYLRAYGRGNTNYKASACVILKHTHGMVVI